MRRNGRHLPALAAILLLLGISPAVAAGPGDVIGLWRDTEAGSTIRIAQCGAGICATLVKIKEKGARDRNNPDPAMRLRRLEGIVILSATKAGRNIWRGKVYNRDDGETYAGSITVLTKDQLKLEGCALIICHSRIWVRLQ
jgi:uncharacterized protein (DUF2147 family)